MCGFLGQFNRQEASLPDEELSNLLALSRERGPDGSHKYTNGENLWFGFNRLAILDLSEAGTQPMHSRNGRFTIVFNGEIYNHLDLRQKLNTSIWRGHSDTETILACVEEWGFEKTIKVLDGMFALAVYDHREKTLYGTRDFAGIKPFFYGLNEKSFVFASQYDQIIKHPGFESNDLDPSVLRLYLEQHFVPAPYGIVRQTGQLQPGEWIKVSEKGVRKEFFWKFPEYEAPSVRDAKTAQMIIAEELAASVSSEMLADVPLGAFLSGGVDSPLICHYASRNSPRQKLKTFSIGSDSRVHDESQRAESYAELIGTDHRSDKMTADSAFTIFEEVMRCLREPMADFSIIPTYLVSKLARREVTVALSGDGADELFFGYERFWSVAKNIRFQRLPWLLRAALYKGDQYLSGNKNLNSVLLAAKQSAAHRGLHSRFSSDWIRRLFPDLADVSAPADYATYEYLNTGSLTKLIQSMRRAEFYGMMQKTLRKVDLASMGVSLEVRVPFLKKSFIESSLKIDPMLSYGPDQKKLLLKSHLTCLYPEIPIDNKKRGFSIPLGKWLRERNFKERIGDNLVEQDFVGRFGVDVPAVKDMLRQHDEQTDNKWPIFTLLALQNFDQNAEKTAPATKKTVTMSI